MHRFSLALLFVAGSGLAVACSACRRGSASGEGESAPPAAASAGANASATASVAPKAAGSAGGGEASAALLWANAKDGDEEDLMALATHEGAAGLVAAARADAERRTIALRAAPSARGYAHVPWLAEVAETGPDEDATLALDALADLGARVRRAEEHEDAPELEAGCTKLAALAKNADKARARRIGAVRAVRTLPCPKLELPVDLDAK